MTDFTGNSSLQSSINDSIYDLNYIPSVYVLKNEHQYTFENILPLDFDLHQTGSPLTDTKIMIKVNLFYKFNNISPDFNLQVLEGKQTLYSEREGISAYSNRYNKLSDEIILDVNDTRDLKIRLTKEDLSSNTIFIQKNSYVIIQKF